MDLFFYASDTKDTGELLWNLHQDVNDRFKGEFYRTINELANRLRQPKDDPTIAVILAGSQKELADMLSIRDLLDRSRIILILPDRSEDTITKGYSMFPRFVTYVDSNFNWVTAVLSKMLSNNKGGNKSLYQ